MNQTEALLQSLVDYHNQEKVDTTYIEAFDASAGDTTFGTGKQVIDTSKFSAYTFQIDADSIAGGADGRIVVQDSIDGVLWSDMIDANGNAADVTLALGNSTPSIRVYLIASRYVRLRFEANSVTGGTIDAQFFGKSN